MNVAVEWKIYIHISGSGDLLLLLQLQGEREEEREKSRNNLLLHLNHAPKLLTFAHCPADQS